MIPAALPLDGSGVARMTNFKLKSSWEFLLQSPLSRRHKAKVGSFGMFSFFFFSFLPNPLQLIYAFNLSLVTFSI